MAETEHVLEERAPLLFPSFDRHYFCNSSRFLGRAIASLLSLSLSLSFSLSVAFGALYTYTTQLLGVSRTHVHTRVAPTATDARVLPVPINRVRGTHFFSSTTSAPPEREAE